MDPFSIATGVVALLGTCVTVGTVLNDFCRGIATIEKKIKGLQGTVQSFIQVLTLMKDTLEQEEVKSSLLATGHINSLWSHLFVTIKDGQETLSQLRNLLEKVNRSASVFSGAQKQARLQDVAQDILEYQQQIQRYSDALQLSLQTVTV